ncbi:hypothetical protein NFI96_016910, partial [Prochilodus magdalenae]
LEHPHTVPADGAVGVEVEGHQAFWTCDNKPFILVLTTVPPHTGIENLPCELQRNFTLMRELDNRTEEKKGEIDKLAEEYISNVRNLASEQRMEHLQKIQNAYSKCKEYSDDKVQLAMQTYEMVDKHIRRLDADLARFENELKEKLDVGGYESPDSRALKKGGGRGLKEKRGPKGRGRKCSDDDSPRKKKMKNSPEFSESLLPVHPSDVLDMPVDPNEPTYCLCHQVSYGEMIGCDNPDDLLFLSPHVSLLGLVSNRVVSLRLCGPYNETQRKMVLSAMHPGSEEKMKCLLLLYISASFSYTLFRKLHLKVIHKVCVVLVAAVALKQHIHLGLPAVQLLIAELVEVFFMWVRAPLCSQALLYSETPQVVTEHRVESLQLCHRHRFQ